MTESPPDENLMTTSFVNWPHKWFGCWREFGAQYARCPSIDDFVDEGWGYARLEPLLGYLSRAPVIATTSRLALPWAKGPGDGRSSVSYRSDGVWLWLDDLDYYVREQSVRPPDAFVARIEERSFEPPPQLEISPADLSWPPADG